MSMPRSQPIPPMMRREDIPYLLEAEGCRRGAELGVLNGEFALHTLDRWPSCVEYVLVDLWSHQDNYLDMYNEAHDTHYRTAMSKLKPHSPFAAISQRLAPAAFGMPSSITYTWTPGTTTRA